MNLPTPEHAETRANEVRRAFEALTPNEPSLSLVVTLGPPLDCECCFETQTGILLSGPTSPERRPSPVEVQNLCGGAFRAIIKTVRRGWDVDDHEFLKLFTHPTPRSPVP